MVTSKEVQHALVMVGVVSNIKINRPPRLFLVYQQDEKPGINFAWPYVRLFHQPDDLIIVHVINGLELTL